MRKLLPWLVVALVPLALAPAAQAQEQVQEQATDCSLAAQLDWQSYADLAPDNDSEAGQDQVAYDWAQCRAAALSVDLKAHPRLRARLALLREQYREMRAIESELAGIRSGGGTMYGHAVPRSYAPLEDRLGSLARLARTSAGGVRHPRFGATIESAQTMHAGYIAALRAYKPEPEMEPFNLYDPQHWNAQVDRYEELGRSIMRTLGHRDDAATALGYSILNDWVFPANW